MERSMYKLFETRPNIKIALGSTCKSKIRGVESAFTSALVKACDVPLEIKQPRSKLQTEELAIARASYAQTTFPDCDLFVGIQNGMWPIESKDNPLPPVVQDGYENMMDGACIYLFGKNVEPVSLWTREVIVISFLQKGKHGEWSNLEDPHYLVSNRPRAYYIEERLRIYLESFFFDHAKLDQSSREKK